MAPTPRVRSLEEPVESFMATSSDKTVQPGLTFEKPSRPPSIRAFNALGKGLRSLGWRRPLCASRVVAKARARTGLSHAGDDYFLEPLDVLVESLEREARLTSTGRGMVRGMLTGAVENRLLIQRYLERYPDAMLEPLSPSLIVVGMPRTGTTLLYALLAKATWARPLLGWESLFPVPRSGAVDRRRARARVVEFLSGRAAPALESIHPFKPSGPEECTWLTINSLMSWAFPMFASVPSYADWLLRASPSLWAKAYADYRLQLQVLQHQRGGQHWVLKSPVHLMTLGPLLDAMPEARIILTERSPRETVPSTCSLFAVMRAIGSDEVDGEALGPEIVDLLAEGMRRADAAISAHDNRALHVAYADLVADPITTVRRICQRFGAPIDEVAERAMARALTHDLQSLTPVRLAGKA